MNEVIKTLLSTLESLYSDVYYKRASGTTLNPYIVFKTPSDTPNEDNDDVVFEVDIRGDNQANPSVYELADTIEKDLNKKRILNDNHFLMFGNAQRLDIPDPDPIIKRIQLRYTVRTYKR